MLYLGLLLSFILEYMRPGTYLPILVALKINTLVPLLVLAGAMYSRRYGSNAELFSHRNSKWLGFFLILLGISGFVSDVQVYNLYVFTAVLGYVFLYLTEGKLIDEDRKLKWFIFTLVTCHAVLVILNPNVVLHPETRSYIDGVTFLGDGNDFALSVVIMIPLCLYLFMSARNKLIKILTIGLVGLLVLAMIGTQSRGASLGLAAVVAYMWWHGRKKILGVVALAILGVGVLMYAPDEYFDRMDTVVNYEQEGSAMARIYAWNAAVRMANDNPLLGVGSGHFSVKLGVEYRPPEWGTGNVPWANAHSIYFLVFGELGYPGLLFLIGILYTNYRSGERVIRRLRTVESELSRRYEQMFVCLNGALIGFAVAGAFLSALYYPHLYMICGLFVAAERMYRRDAERLFSAPVQSDAAQQLSMGPAT